MTQAEEIKKIFKDNGGFMSTSQLCRLGIYYKKLNELLDQNVVCQIKRGCYQLVEENAFSDIPIITKLFPDGIFFMESALEHYDYLERTPSAWHVAVDSQSSRTRFSIEYPIIKPHFIKADRLNIGVTESEIDGVKVKIYDREKTICDCLHHRNKIDAEVFNHAIRSYVKDKNKNPARLAQYAQVLHVEKKVREVLGVWL